MTMAAMTDERAAWLEERRRFLGGSDMPHVFNEEASCARQLAYSKLATKPDFPDELAALERDEILRGGRAAERFVAEEYGERTGRALIVPEGPFIHPEVPFARAHLDREILPIEGHDGPGALEVKTHNEYLYKQVVTGGLRRAHILQFQWELFASQRTWGSFAVAERGSALLAAVEQLEGNPPLAPIKMLSFDLERDDEMIALEVTKGTQFWALIQNGLLPDPLDEVGRTCRRCQWRRTCRGPHMQPQPPRQLLEPEYDDSLELDNAVSDYKIKQNERGEVDAQLDVLREKVVTLLTVVDANGALVRVKDAVRTVSGGKVYYKEQRRTGYDTRALDGLSPVVVPENARADQAVALLADHGIAARSVVVREQFKITGAPFRSLRIYEGGGE